MARTGRVLEEKRPDIVPVERFIPVKIADSPEPPGWKAVPDNRVKRPDGSLWDPDTGLIQYPDGRLMHDLVYRPEKRQKETSTQR